MCYAVHTAVAAVQGSVCTLLWCALQTQLTANSTVGDRNRLTKWVFLSIPGLFSCCSAFQYYRDWLLIFVQMGFKDFLVIFTIFY